jgi:hypothetical protein
MSYPEPVIPPAASGLPDGALDSATEGANRLDAHAVTPGGRNLLAHALVQLARDGWLRPECDLNSAFEPCSQEPVSTQPANLDPELAALLNSCPAAHGTLGRICELPAGHPGMHTGSGPNGGAVWDGDASA